MTGSPDAAPVPYAQLMPEPAAARDLLERCRREFQARFRLTGRDFAYVEPDPETIVWLQRRRARAWCDFKAGFPFDTFNVSLSELALPGFAARIHARGQRLRDLQFDELVASTRGLIDWIDPLSSPGGAIASDGKAPADVLVCVDPFRFSGDSIALLRLFDHVRTQLKHRRVELLTVNPTMHGLWGLNHRSTNDLKAHLSSLAGERCIVVLPDFMDAQWDLTSSLVRHMAAGVVAGTILVPGRNLILHGDSGRWSGMRLRRSDVTIHALSMHEQFDESCKVFGLGPLPARRMRDRAALPRSAFINAFADNPRKCLSMEAIDAFVGAWRERFGADARVMFNMGSCGHRADPAWIAALGGGAARMEIFAPATLGEAAQAIGEASVVFSCDSAPSHIADRLEVPCITAYNSTRWDPFSPASVFHHSPVGFASRSALHMPLACHWAQAGVVRDPGRDGLSDCLTALLDGPSLPLRQTASLMHDRLADQLAQLAGTASPRNSARPQGRDAASHWLARWWPHEQIDSCLRDAATDVRLAALRSAVAVSPAAKIAALI